MNRRRKKQLEQEIMIVCDPYIGAIELPENLKFTKEEEPLKPLFKILFVPNGKEPWKEVRTPKGIFELKEFQRIKDLNKYGSKLYMIYKPTSSKKSTKESREVEERPKIVLSYPLDSYKKEFQVNMEKMLISENLERQEMFIPENLEMEKMLIPENLELTKEEELLFKKRKSLVELSGGRNFYLKDDSPSGNKREDKREITYEEITHEELKDLEVILIFPISSFEDEKIKEKLGKWESVRTFPNVRLSEKDKKILDTSGKEYFPNEITLFDGKKFGFVTEEGIGDKRCAIYRMAS